MVDRRTSGVPLEHVVGWAEFCGIHIEVDPGVFVPRRRSELLVREAVSLAGSTAVIVDLCCGSGAVGAAIAASVDEPELHVADIDRAAVRCANRNVAGAGGTVYEGDLYDPLPASLRGRVDLLVANAPYVPSDEIDLLPAEARLHEPRVALDGGVDGLAIQRRVISEAPRWLATGGHLLIETSERQAALTADAVVTSGLVARVARSAPLQATVVVGTAGPFGSGHRVM
ncbi:MAG: release factor glutamine methyltransferase [Actinomycetota bacterium]|nr:release factor glutamine methyltransferase [Actinomycetota bacterium]